MKQQKLTRREAIALSFGSVLAGFAGTGCNEKQGNAVAEGLIAIGGVVVLIPHWLGKVIGIALVGGGAVLKVWFACADGTEMTVEIPLTSEDKQTKIAEAIAHGDKFKVKDPKGHEEFVAPRE